MPIVNSVAFSKPYRTPFVVVVMFATGLRTPVLFSSDKVPPAIFSDLNIMNDVIYYNTWYLKYNAVPT